MMYRSLNWAFVLCIGLFATVFFVGLTGCTGDKSQPNIEVIQDMMDQPAIKTQDFMPDDREKSGMRLPPEGTQARNREIVLYKNDPDAASSKLKNELEFTPENIALGKKHYMNYCFVCHGEQGKGDGPVGKKFQGVKPPSLLTTKIQGWKDGRIYHVITFGQGVMGHYSNHMPMSKDRWATVMYVRQLQKENK